MSDTDLQWKSPTGRAQAGTARVIADALRANQNEWAIIEEHVVPVAPDGASEDEVASVREQAKKVRARASSRASLIKQGRVAAYRGENGNPGAFDAVSRSEDGDGGQRVIRVYARYIGEPAATEASAEN